MSGVGRYSRAAFWMRLLHSFGHGTLVEKLRRRMWRFGPVVSSHRRMAAKLDVDPRKVLFVTSSWNCTCNPKYVARELARRRPDVDIVWILYAASMRACGGRRSGSGVYATYLSNLDNAVSLQFFGDGWRTGLDMLRKWRPGVFCFNDTEASTDEDRAWLRNTLESLFPVRSSFELDGL